jgi:hypothetical protein
LISFIKGDLERLYMNGVTDEYFKTDRRQAMLLNILFIWAQLHPQTSYRQGMHEIVAPFLLVLEEEREEWAMHTSSSSVSASLSVELSLFAQALCGKENNLSSQDAALEAQTYWLFDRIMIDLETLYSPITGADEQPAIVHFCTKIQEHMLRGLDPPLCRHLEENFIQAQLYGMRWSRLLLGREFELTELSLLRIWDYMFACIFDAEIALRVSSGSAAAHYKDGSNSNSHAHAILRKQHSSQRDVKAKAIVTATAVATKESTKASASEPASQQQQAPPSDPLSGALFVQQSSGEEDEEEEEVQGREESHLLRRDGSRDSDDTDDDDILWTTGSAVIKTSSRFGPSSPLLNALSDFMLAMLLHVRPSLPLRPRPPTSHLPILCSLPALPLSEDPRPADSRRLFLHHVPPDEISSAP